LCCLHAAGPLHPASTLLRAFIVMLPALVVMPLLHVVHARVIHYLDAADANYTNAT
jgi:hypothetical protein